MERLKPQDMEKKLLAYVTGNKVHPALILSGTDAESKALTVRRMAKAALCPKSAKQPPFCGACSTCRRIDQGNHPDVLWLASDPIKIDQIRDLCHQMELTPVESPTKIAIIENAQRMNTASANAFLKSLEEPPPGRYFWLLVNQASALLPTLVSRCLVFHFPSPEQGVSEAAQWESLLDETATSADFHSLIQRLKEKESCLDLVHYLQSQWRLAALHPHLGQNPSQVFQSASFWDALLLFEEAVQLEGRLRSNANPGLLLESHLRASLFGRNAEDRP